LRIADFRFVLRTPTLRAGSRFQIEERSIKWAQQDNYMFPLPSKDCVAIRHFYWIPDLAPQSGARPEWRVWKIMTFQAAKRFLRS